MVKPKISAVIAAAGSSSRMNMNPEEGGEGGDGREGGSKQFIEIGGKPVIYRTLEVFEASGYISEIIIAARRCDIGRLEKLAGGFSKIKSITEGGETRLESVAEAVRRVSQSAEYIAVHDGARCFVRLEDIEKVALCAFKTGAAAAGCRVYDTVKRIEGGRSGNDDDNGGRIAETLPRGSLRTVQTPQIFLKELYLSALENADTNAPDDCYILERAGYKVTVAECSRYNIKITDAEDLKFLSMLHNLSDLSGGVK